MPENNHDQSVRKRMQILSGRYIDGTITDSEAAEMLELLRAHPHWNQHLADQLLTDNLLANDELFVEAVAEPEDDLPRFRLPQRALRRNRSPWFQRIAGSLALVSILAIGVAVFVRTPTDRTEIDREKFVSITRTTNCLWGDSATLTRPGSRLGPCTLHLEQGIALLHFDCGVAVSLEGPAVFEIQGEKQAVLHSGRLVATAETPEGKGFVVDTPDSSIKDLGTKFAVYVPKDEPSEVYVLDGSVEVKTRELENTRLLEKGERMTVGVRNGNGRRNGNGQSGHRITTAMGRGKEAWVIFAKKALEETVLRFPEGISEPYMQVKTEIRGEKPTADRKAIFSLDLSVLDESVRKTFVDATLLLSYGPTEIGYASNVSDATFTVYGLTDENHDDWNEATTDWQNFPGNAVRNTLDASMWQPLGNFEIKQGSRTGTVRIDDDRLAEFLKRDTNGLATFAIVCDTFAIEGYSIVFGFANRHHTELQPPRLFFSH